MFSDLCVPNMHLYNIPLPFISLLVLLNILVYSFRIIWMMTMIFFAKSSLFIPEVIYLLDVLNFSQMMLSLNFLDNFYAMHMAAICGQSTNNLLLNDLL